MTSREKKLILSLKQDIGKINRALAGYMYSYRRCLEIYSIEVRSADQEVEFEALTSRFARLVDLLTQKLLKGLFALLQEELATFIDRANYAEKLGMVTSAQSLRIIRELRNRIAHEYEEEDFREIHNLLFEVHADLLSSIQQSIEYADRTLEQLSKDSL